MNVAKDSFARKLKVSAARCFGFEGTDDECVEFCEDLKHDTDIYVSKQIGPMITGPEPQPPEYEVLAQLSGRTFLQLFGTEAHRDVFGTGFWVNALFKQYDEVPFPGSQPDLLVITDARFENEARAVNERGGAVIEVVRPDNPDGLSGGLEQQHASEAGLPEHLITYRIINDGSLDDLRTQVEKACFSLLAEKTI
jgi:hypothetical protein